MLLPLPGRPHLTYCTNIHPGETWEEVKGNIERHVLAVKDQVSPDRPFGIGLRLSAEAAHSLSKPDALEDFCHFLRAHGLYVFTLNGFPYGAFHDQRIKDRVYLPDWRDGRRLAYADELAEVLATLLSAAPDHMELEGSISTVPGGFRSHTLRESEIDRMADLMLRHLVTLFQIRERTGRIISLALEPEPCCVFETAAETIEFFESRLFSRTAVSRFASMTGLSMTESGGALRRHIGVCFDACHLAVEYEEPVGAVRGFEAAGIRISKIQLSAGLQVSFAEDPRQRIAALEQFNEGTYLHQVVERRNGQLIRYEDLPQALHALRTRESRLEQPDAWRIHFHVPLFRERLGLFTNTQEFLEPLLGLVRSRPVSDHLEVETYTWSVLPDEYRGEDIVTSVVREMQWVVERLSG